MRKYDFEAEHVNEFINTAYDKMARLADNLDLLLDAAEAVVDMTGTAQLAIQKASEAADSAAVATAKAQLALTAQVAADGSAGSAEISMEAAVEAKNDALGVASALAGLQVTVEGYVDQVEAYAASAIEANVQAGVKRDEARDFAADAYGWERLAAQAKIDAEAASSTAVQESGLAAQARSGAVTAADAAQTSLNLVNAVVDGVSSSATAAQQQAISAATSAGLAGSHASAAFNHKEAAATSASDAAGSASSASNSAILASNSEISAGDFAEAASGYAENASTSVTEAASHATASRNWSLESKSFRDDASSAASAATNEAERAETYVTDALNHSIASRDYSLEAETYRDQASGFSNTALGYRDAALAHSQAALAQKQLAESFADDASTSATAAQQSSLSAESSRTSAEALVARAPVLPWDFQEGLKYWRTSASGDPALVGSQVNLAAVTGDAAFGPACDWSPTGLGQAILHRGVLSGPGRKYRITIKFKVVSVSSGTTVLLDVLAQTLNSSYAAVSAYSSNAVAYAVGSTVHTLTVVYAQAAGLGVTDVGLAIGTQPFVRFGLRIDEAKSAVIRVGELRVEDVTTALEASTYAKASFDEAERALSFSSDAEDFSLVAATEFGKAESARKSTELVLAQAPAMPSSFKDGLIYWQSSRTGDPAVQQAQTSMVAVTGDVNFGAACEWSPSTVGASLMHRGVLVAPGKKYKITAKFRVVSVTGGTPIQLNLVGTTLDGTYQQLTANTSAAIGYAAGSTVHVVTAVFAEATETGVSVVLAGMATSPFIRFGLRLAETKAAVIRVGEILVEEVTGVLLAEQSANAAFQSAQNAETHATNAGNSATASSGSATLASTKASEANTSAGQAATSAGQASTSASQASTSASNAAGSASAASSSATTAATAATTATTKAGEADTSADLASGYAATATTKASEASTASSSAQAAEATAKTYRDAAAKVSSGGVSRNPVFNLWPGTNPDFVGLSNSGGSTTAKQTTGVKYLNAVLMTSAASPTSNHPQMSLSVVGNGLIASKNPDRVLVRGEVELVSGSFASTGVRAGWEGTTPVYGDVNLGTQLKNEIGTVQTFEILIERPAGHVPGASPNFFIQLVGVWNLAGPRVACSFLVHKFDYEVLTANSIASITQQAKATLDGIQAASIVMRAKAGTGGAELELVSLSDPAGGSVSTARISANNIILDGSVTANKLSVTDLSAISANLGTIQVDTLNIAGQAVTVPASANTDYLGAVYTAPTQLISLTMTRRAGVGTFIGFAVSANNNQSNNGTWTSIVFDVKRGGTIIKSFHQGYTAARISPYFAFYDPDTAGGATTYTVDMYILNGYAFFKCHDVSIQAVQYRR